MTVNSQEQPVEKPVEQSAAKPNDKEYNFAQIRGQLDRQKQENAALQQELEKARKAAEAHLKRSQAELDDDDDDDEPYIDKKRLNKKLAKYDVQVKEETDKRIQSAVHRALSEERQNNWLKSNPDFYEVMQQAQTFADKDPELAETILAMPEGFERQKLVYKNIKALGLHKKEEPKSSVQDQIDKNRKSPYYIPPSVGSAPYGATSDFSPTGQKSAYQKMKELQQKARF